MVCDQCHVWWKSLLRPITPFKSSIFRKVDLHIFGGLLLGGLRCFIICARIISIPGSFLDAAGPAMLIGQAIGRIANFINQELYGPPTTLPWGIPISAEHRLPQFANLPASTRFHPTFAYEMIWNLATARLLLWLSTSL